MRVFVTGGTGLIGRPLVARLLERGDEVVILSRSSKTATRDRLTCLVGDLAQRGPWLEEIARCDAILHLAGEPVAQRWTRSVRARIRASRVDSTLLIAEQLAQSPRRSDGSPRVFVCSSGVGFYGSYRDLATEFTENDLPGSGFLADVCVAWEQATHTASAAGVRVASLRTGMVLAREGGALPKIALPFRLCIGGTVGGGKQWVSWIHLHDMVGLVLFALDQPNASGPINAVAPESVTNWGFSKALARALHRPCWLPAPALGLRLLLGEMSELMTHGQRVVPTRARQLGYEFRFPLLDDALRDLYPRKA